jgi:hypothetical protein
METHNRDGLSAEGDRKAMEKVITGEAGLYNIIYAKRAGARIAINMILVWGMPYLPSA